MLTTDEVLQLGDALLGLLAAAGVCLAQRKDFIGDGIEVLLAVGLSDEHLLQLVEPCLDTVRAHRVGIYYRFCDVLLHSLEETVAIGEYPIEGLDRDLLQ